MSRPIWMHAFPVMIAISIGAPRLPGQLDTARAFGALRDAATACRADGGSTWGKSLCGPIALVDPQTRLVIANDSVPGRHFIKAGDAFITTLPASQYVANTSFRWGNRDWTMVALPLPADRFARLDLLMHESFHREQQSLGLRQPDALNNHLDMRAGRTWLRLEYRALARALDALPDQNAARHHAESALIFRARRRAIYPGADSLESTLEIQEGLAEYTGQRLALQLTGEGPARVAAYVRSYETTPSFVRAFAYGSGPAIGLLLDNFSPGWRRAVLSRRDIGGLLGQAIGFRLPRDLARQALARAGEYDWTEVDRAEGAREALRAPVIADYRARLVEGPTVTLQQSMDSLAWSFDPTALVGFDLRSTIYPSGNFTAPWGKLVVETGGVLVRNDFSRITVAASQHSAVSPTGEIRGDGWFLTLNPGWSLRPDSARPASQIAVRAP